MNRRLATTCLLAATLTLAGCAQPQVRSQKEEQTDHERYAVRTVGDVSSFGNADTILVTGVGLIEGLEGTGSPTPAGEMRQIVENELKRQREKDVKGILNSPDFAVVMVQAVIPAGSKKGDKLDLEVSLPPGSRATSLRGGRLRRCSLYNYDYTANLSPTASGRNAALKGHPLVKGEGPLLAGVSGGEELERLKKARVWGGGYCQVDRQFIILLNAQNQQTAVAGNLAARVNAAFQDSVLMTPGNELAIARSNTSITLAVPARYKLNLPRLLRVVRMVPLEDKEPKDPKKPVMSYKEQVALDLLDPARTVSAALRLEALGGKSIPALKEGLNHAHPLVRFCSAEALAYLGSPSAGEELARVVEQQPYLRAFALTAMASLDEAVCHVKLKELLQSDLNDETRYGAFRAYRTLDEQASEVRGEHLGDSFWLHEVAPGSQPFVHMSTTRRAEIVLFGDAPKLVPPLAIVAGEFAITAPAGAERCTVTHIPLHTAGDQEARVPCTLELPKLIRVLAELGASYPEVVEVLRQADSCKNLTCRVKNDLLPQSATVEQIAQAGREEKLGKETPGAVQIIKPTKELGSTPTLYQNGVVRRRAPFDADVKALRQEKPDPDAKQTAERK